MEKWEKEPKRIEDQGNAGLSRIWQMELVTGVRAVVQTVDKQIQDHCGPTSADLMHPHQLPSSRQSHSGDP